MSCRRLLFDVSDRVATVTINRPDKLNVLNDTVIAELEHAACEIRARKDMTAFFEKREPRFSGT